jgi:hypothetical protein
MNPKFQYILISLIQLCSPCFFLYVWSNVCPFIVSFFELYYFYYCNINLFIINVFEMCILYLVLQ